MSTSNTIYADGISEFIAKGLSKLIGHGLLGYAAHKTAEILDKDKEESTVKKIARRFVLWTGAEGLTSLSHERIQTIWDQVQPSIKHFSSPLIRMFLSAAVPNGTTVLPLVDKTEESWYQLPSNLIESLNYYFNNDPVVPLSANFTAPLNWSQHSEQHASIAGEWVANGLANIHGFICQGLDMTYDITNSTFTCVNASLYTANDVIDTLSKAFEIPYPITALATATIGFFSLYGLKSVVTNTYQSVMQIQETHANANANSQSNGNTLVLNLNMADKKHEVLPEVVKRPGPSTK